MIATAERIGARARPVVKSRRRLVRDSDFLRERAADELRAALAGVSVKRIDRADVPGAGRTWISRCRNGDMANPLYRLASIFILGRMLGIPKSRFQRLIDWLQSQLDRAYDDTPEPDLGDVLDHDAELDPTDDVLRFRAAMGCPDALRELLEAKRRQLAFAPQVIRALQVRVEGARAR